MLADVVVDLEVDLQIVPGVGDDVVVLGHLRLQKGVGDVDLVVAELARNGLVAKRPHADVAGLVRDLDLGHEAFEVHVVGEDVQAEVFAVVELVGRIEVVADHDASAFHRFADAKRHRANAALAHVVGQARHVHPGRDGVQGELAVDGGHVARAEIGDGAVGSGDGHGEGAVAKAGRLQGEFFHGLAHGRGVGRVEQGDLLVFLAHHHLGAFESRAGVAKRQGELALGRGHGGVRRKHDLRLAPVDQEQITGHAAGQGQNQNHAENKSFHGILSHWQPASYRPGPGSASPGRRSRPAGNAGPCARPVRHGTDVLR